MRRILHIIPVCSLLLVVFITYANTVDDLDLWWHLKSGQLIHETRTIPHIDDFAHTSYVPKRISDIGKNEVPESNIPSEDKNQFWSSGFIKRNWLSQITLYLIYVSGGFTGIGLFKSSIFVLSYLVLYMTMLRRGSGYVSSFFVLCLVAYLGLDFNYTRPQMFSYLLFTSTIFILHDVKRGGKSMYFLPLLILTWANIHGGFVLGVLLILAFTFAEGIKYLLNTSAGISKISCLPAGQLKQLTIIATASVFISLISPGGYKTYMFAWVMKDSLFASIDEYQRPMLYEYHAFWFMLCLVILAIVILILKKRLDLTDLFISLVVVLPALNSNKYIIYFALGTGGFLAYAMTSAGSRIKEWDIYKELFHSTALSKLHLKGTFSLLLAAISFFALCKIYLSGNLLKFETREWRYPSGAVTFIQENRLEGNMFNLFNWGGYLVWRLYPEHRVFIYGRAVNETALFHYHKIVNSSTGNDSRSSRPLWKRLLDAYNVNFIVTSALSSTGSIVPLVNSLYQDSEWELIYKDGRSMIFLKSSDNNYDMIHKRYLSKEKIYDEIISEGTQGIKESPATWGYYETLGFVYMNQNRFDDALIMFEKYLSMNPGNQTIRHYYGLVKRYVKEHN